MSLRTDSTDGLDIAGTGRRGTKRSHVQTQEPIQSQSPQSSSSVWKSGIPSSLKPAQSASPEADAKITKKQKVSPSRSRTTATASVSSSSAQLLPSLSTTTATVPSRADINLDGLSDSDVDLESESAGQKVKGPAPRVLTAEERHEIRLKQIEFVKNTPGYQQYTKQVQRTRRTRNDPLTPDIKRPLSKRASVRSSYLFLLSWLIFLAIHAVGMD